MTHTQIQLTEAKPFLPKRPDSPGIDEEREFGDRYIQIAKKDSSRRKHHLTTWFIHLIILAGYTFIFLILWKYSQFRCSQIDGPEFARTYSPAASALKWEVRTFENQLEISNPYKGPPRPEFEEAWNNLLHPSAAILVDKETLHKINRSSVELLDGSGYMAALDVYHQLHCLRWVRRYIHQDHYNMMEENLGQHIDHCLEGLRQYVMCNADLSINTFDWIPNYPKPWPNFEVVHKCANWESIEEWVLSNSFDGYDPDLIRHPNYNPELPSPFNFTISGNSP